MSETIKTESELFYGGPPLQLQRALGLIKPDEPRIVLRALLAVLGGTLEYGALATGEGLQFERKWLKRLGTIDESALEASDFLATTDLYQIVANVYDMGVIPLDLRNLLLLIIATLLPFVPVLLMALPFEVILQELAGLLL
jgi:hypothetical protein